MYCQYSKCDCVVVHQIENACAECELRLFKDEQRLKTFTNFEVAEMQSLFECIEAVAMLYMYKTNVSSLLIEQVPSKDIGGELATPIKITIEPFGGPHRLQLIKRCLGKSDKGESK